MADRTVRVRLEAMTAAYLAAMRQASAVTTEFARNIAGVGDVADKNLERVGKAALIAAGGLTLGLGLSARAAVSWESAFAGVRKTVDGTAQDMQRLEGGLRNMATRLPATHGEIAAVAEAAGQLGVAVGGIEDFTEVMINLGETTDLTADRAAVGIARITNIMGTSNRDVERFGSTLVDLGNSSAATESEILELTTRLAAAGQIAGLSESDVLAFAATLASVGVEAEAGGTALSKVFTAVRDAVLDGGDALDTFAGVAGMSAEQFRAAFEEDAAGAIASFVEGLGRINESGQSTTAIFEQLELTDQRLIRSLLSTAGAGDLLRESIERGNQAWIDNTALATEAEKRYETTAARLEVLRNQAVEVGIGFGEVLLPAISATTDNFGSMLAGVRDLPGPLDAVAVGIGGVSAAGLGAIGLLGMFGPKVREARDALMSMGTAGQFVGRNLGRLAGGLAVAGVALAGYSWYLGEQRKQQMEAEEAARGYTDAIREQRSALGALTDELGLQAVLEGELGEALRAAGADLGVFTSTLREVPDGLAELPARIRDFMITGKSSAEVLQLALRDTGLAGTELGDEMLRLVQTGDLSASQMLTLARRLQEQAAAHQTGAREAENQAAAEQAAGTAAEDAAGGVDELTSSLLSNIGAAQGSGDAVRDMIDAYRGGFDVIFGFQDALAAVEDHQRQVARAAQAAADARQDAVRAANDVAQAEREVAEAMRMVVDEQEAARRGIQNLASAQRAAIDPFFAVLDALERQHDVLNPKRSTREKKPGEAVRTGSSPTGVDPLDAAQAAAAVDQAFLNLAGAIRTGDVSLAQGTQMLQRWVAQGFITQQHADTLAKKFSEAAAQAQNLHGATVDQAAAAEIAAEWMEAEEERAERVRDANDRLRDAKERLTDAQERARDAADEHARAAEGLERKVLDLWTASLELNAALERNPGLVLEAKRALEEWVEQGLITEEQARRIAERIDQAVEAANRFQGTRTLQLQIATNFDQVLGALNDFNPTTQITQTIVAAIRQAWEAGWREFIESGDSSKIPGLPAVPNLEGGLAGGGPALPFRTYLVGEEGPELLTMGATGGFVTPTGPTMAALSGWSDWTSTGAARGMLGGSGGVSTTDNSQTVFQVAIPETVARRMDERELVSELGLLQWKRGRR